MATSPDLPDFRLPRKIVHDLEEVTSGSQAHGIVISGKTQQSFLIRNIPYRPKLVTILEHQAGQPLPPIGK